MCGKRFVIGKKLKSKFLTCISCDRLTHEKCEEKMSPFKCVHLCEQSFVTYLDQQNHLKGHENIINWRCSVSNEKFQTREEVEVHQRNLHDSLEKSFSLLARNMGNVSEVSSTINKREIPLLERMRMTLLKIGSVCVCVCLRVCAYLSMFLCVRFTWHIYRVIHND